MTAINEWHLTLARTLRGICIQVVNLAYGEDDAFGIADLPDATGGLAFSLAVDAFGAVRLSTIPLITPEEIDAATKKVIAYRPPGA